jgi:hypothetical protein
MKSVANRPIKTGAPAFKRAGHNAASPILGMGSSMGPPGEAVRDASDYARKTWTF